MEKKFKGIFLAIGVFVSLAALAAVAYAILQARDFPCHETVRTKCVWRWKGKERCHPCVHTGFPTL